MSELDDVELVMLRRYLLAAKANNTEEINRLSTALEVFREARDTARGLVRMSGVSSGPTPDRLDTMAVRDNELTYIDEGAP